MTYNELKISYETTIETETFTLSKLKQKIFRVGTLRLLIVLAAFVGGYTFWANTVEVILLVLASLVVYLVLAKYHNRLFYKKTYVESIIQNAKNELKALDYDFTAFDGGNEYIDPDHNYSLDLDIFGNKSFFQSINRTVTAFGKKTLAYLVLNPLQTKSDILLRQEAVEELRRKMELIRHFRAVGQIGKTQDLDLDFFSQQEYKKSGVLAMIFPFLAPLLFIIIVISCVLNVLPTGIIPIYWFAMIIITQLVSKNIKKKVDFLDKKKQIINTYSALLSIIESEKFSSSYLIQIQEYLSTPMLASKRMSILKKYCHNMDLSFTFAGIVLLNPVLAWNVIFSERIDRWTYRHRDEMKKWFDIVGEFDSMVSLAIFAYNHPDYGYPQLIDKRSIIACNMKHPMMDRDVCVGNDISEPSCPYFMVVTGANMAGKSTYLRTIGINLILAEIGSVVSASSFCFYPFKLVTNLRTSDSLNDNESYFFAELKRLKKIIDQLQSGEELFIILDEILKGTNSEDKQRGSIALMKQLISLSGNGIIATHDLELGSLEEEFPGRVKNYRFEADINNDNLAFTYLMKEGVAQNMNACFLMNKMGITIDIKTEIKNL